MYRPRFRCSKQGTNIKVAIYTRRQLLLKYTSQFRDSMICLQWDPVIIAFPSKPLEHLGLPVLIPEITSLGTSGGSFSLDTGFG